MRILKFAAIVFISASAGLGASGDKGALSQTDLAHITEMLNPKVDSAAILEVKEWNGGRLSRTSVYRAFFHGQNVLLLRKLFPEKERGRSILMRENSMWIELPTARRPLQLSSEQRLTSEATVADLARANFQRDYHVQSTTEEFVTLHVAHLFLTAAHAGVPYEHVELWVDKTSGKPNRAMFVSAGSTLSRECQYGSYRYAVGMIRPNEVDCSDVGSRQWKAQLVFKDWTETKVDPRFLEPSSLGKEELVVTRPKEPPLSNKHEGQLDGMVAVPEGTFIMGRDNGFPDEQPAHEVHVKAFSIDRTAVTVVQYKRFLRAKHIGTATRPSSYSMPPDYLSAVNFERFPAVDVSWQDANEYCRSIGKRLPTEAEWEKAARGTDQRLYPWGNVWDERKANSRETPYSSIAGRSIHFTSKVGSYGENVSPYGAFDMAGNVWEWVDDWYLAYSGNSSPNDAYGKRYRVLRGGSWVSNSLSLTTVARDYSDPKFGYDSVGFRCAKGDDE